jgi:nucleotide-binding universal stress UspA family protein
MELRKILIPLDFSDHSRQALRWGMSLAKKYGAQMLLLHVIPEVLEEVSARESAGERLVIDLTAEIEAQLQEIAYQEVREGGSMQVKVLDGKPAEEILRVAHEEAVDLIIMGTHGRTGLPHLLLGSIAEAVVRAAPCPVFTVKPSPKLAP